MRKRRGFLAALLLVVALVAAGCGAQGGSGGDAGAKTISILTPYLSSVTTNEMVESLKAQAEANGWRTNVVDTKGDVGAMASRMEDVIASNADAIVIVSTDPNQLQAQIRAAAEKGIPVFGCDSGYIDGMSMNATSDNAAMSKLITDYLFEQMGEEGKLVALTHRPHPGVLKRSEQLDAQLTENSAIELVTEQHVDVPGPIENARKHMESLLLANQQPGAITAVWAAWDEPAIGAAQAIQAAGRSDIIVTGIDGNSQAVAMIQEGGPLVATVKQNFAGMAELVTAQIKRVFDGQSVEATEMYAPATLITKENASEFAAE
ncbi:sugar ABC transporter substrate-binding protein [Paenibacillus sp.]|uniref:sugar ABC transporter substrate-binding protein n=1 Tax=Paenibacillus sp. TaxID=58172 RepID=UPI002D5BB1D8|nr:substrate-binding domain-containing protein [Paenibacillus sp.]HZG88074.1 substrate-binding domain-containing protein [Paenibacillus sp.]